MIWQFEATLDPSAAVKTEQKKKMKNSSSSSSYDAMDLREDEDGEEEDDPRSLFLEEDEVEQKEQWVCRQRLRAHGADIYDLCWSPDSRGFITGAIDRSVFVWRMSFSEPKCKFHSLSGLLSSAVLTPAHLSLDGFLPLTVFWFLLHFLFFFSFSFCGPETVPGFRVCAGSRLGPARTVLGDAELWSELHCVPGALQSSAESTPTSGQTDSGGAHVSARGFQTHDGDTTGGSSCCEVRKVRILGA